jgi:hypothetical protein
MSLYALLVHGDWACDVLGVRGNEIHEENLGKEWMGCNGKIKSLHSCVCSGDSGELQTFILCPLKMLY